MKERPIVTVEVPVLGNGEVLYVMSFSPPIEIFQTIIEKQRPGEDWTISIFDSEGKLELRRELDENGPPKWNDHH